MNEPWLTINFDTLKSNSTHLTIHDQPPKHAWSNQYDLGFMGDSWFHQIFYQIHWPCMIYHDQSNLIRLPWPTVIHLGTSSPIPSADSLALLQQLRARHLIPGHSAKGAASADLGSCHGAAQGRAMAWPVHQGESWMVDQIVDDGHVI